MLDTEIERKMILRHQAHTRHKIGSQAEIGLRFVLEVAPDSLDERRDGYQGFQVFADSSTALDRCRSDDSLQTRLLTGQVRHIVRLAQRLVQLNAYLDVDHPHDRQALRLLV